MTLTLLAAFAGATAVFVAAGSLTGQFAWTRRRALARAVNIARQRADPSPGSKVTLFKDDTLSGSPAVSSLLRRFSWARSRAIRLERADLPLKVSEYVLILVASFAAATAMATVVSGLILAGLGFGAGTAILVELWLGSRARRQLGRFEQQLPVALQVMATSLKSGFGVMEAVQTVAREMDAPLATEFNRIINDARVGGSFEDSLTAMVERIDSQDLRIVARAIQIHRNVGGDLAAILENVAATMRERDELRGHIRALTAQQRTSGIIVGLLPLWVLGFFSVVSPDFISPLWEEPTGRLLLAAGAGMEVVAFLAMRRAMTIEV